MKRDIKLMKKRGKDISKLTRVLSLLASGEQRPAINWKFKRLPRMPY